jgi:Protein of unknown function (DUF3119)
MVKIPYSSQVHPAMTTTQSGSTTLNPSYKLPIGLIIIALAVLFLPIHARALGIVLALLGLFLLYQSTTIRLVFTAVALEVKRNDQLLQTFPYDEWQSWKIFWPAVPILFYFKEVNSIHFLPVLFDPQQLRDCLALHCASRENDDQTA